MSWGMSEEDFKKLFTEEVVRQDLLTGPAYNTLWEKAKNETIARQKEMIKEALEAHKQDIMEHGRPTTEAYQEYLEQTKAKEAVQTVNNEPRVVANEHVEVQVIEAEQPKEFTVTAVDSLEPELTEEEKRMAREITMAQEQLLAEEQEPIVTEFTVTEQELNDKELARDFANDVLDMELVDDRENEEIHINDDELTDEDARIFIHNEANELFKAYVAYAKEPDDENLRALNSRINEYNKEAQTTARKPSQIPQFIGKFKNKKEQRKAMRGEKIDRRVLDAAMQNLKADQKAVIRLAMLNKDLYAEDIAQVISRVNKEKLNAVEMYKAFDKIKEENRKDTRVKERKGGMNL